MATYADDGAPPLSIVELSNRYWTFLLCSSPELCTYLGFAGDSSKLDSFTEDVYSSRLQFCHQLMEEIGRIDPAALSPTEEATRRIIKYNLSICSAGLEFESHLMPLNHLEGVDSVFLRHTLGHMELTSDDDYRNYIKRMKAFPTQVSQKIDLMKRGLQKGIVPYQPLLIKTAEHLKEALSKRIETLPYYNTLVTAPDEISVETRKHVTEQSAVLVEECIQQPLLKLYTFLQETYIPNLRINPSVTSLPGGLSRYQAHIRFFCDVDWSPQYIHDLGRREVQSLLTRLQKVMKKTGFPGSDLQEYVTFIQEKDELFFESKENALAYCESTVTERIRPHIAGLFWDLPAQPVRFKLADPGASGPIAVYHGGSYDGSQPGELLLTLTHTRRLPKHEVLTLMLHEVEPGHHLQHSVMKQQTEMPDFRRYKDDRVMFEAPGRFPLNTAYTEGWGLYAEQLGDELGLFADPYDELGFCCHNIFRAARLVVDTGIHALGWSRDEAAAYMAAHLPVSPDRQAMEIDRYIAWPAQACSYKIGHLRINELRDKAKRDLGPLFDIRDFHDTVLTCGQVPLDILENIVNKYIATKATKPEPTSRD